MSLALFELFWLSTYPIYALLGIILLATGLSKGIYLSSLNILYRCVQQLHIHLCDFLGISRSTYMISDSMLIVLLKLIQQIFKRLLKNLLTAVAHPLRQSSRGWVLVISSEPNSVQRQAQDENVTQFIVFLESRRFGDYQSPKRLNR